MFTVSFLLWTLLGCILAIPAASFFEWTLHRYVMHRPIGKFRYAFQAHAVVHHQTFKADRSYHLIHDKDKETIPMAWWNGPILIVIFNTPVVLLGLIFANGGIVLGSLITFTLYYLTYEYIHWCMHLPKDRAVERPWFYRRLNGHHLLHHRYMHKNFNVVLPLADFCMGTLMLRSKIKFAQATGKAVPNVQPLETNAPENMDATPEDSQLSQNPVGA